MNKLYQNIIQYLSYNSELVQGLSSILTVILTLIMLIIAIKALQTYKSQILFELEIESKAIALRTFELYIKLNKSEFHEHLLKGAFQEKYDNSVEFYGEDFIGKNNLTIVRRFLIEQTVEEIEMEMKEINKVIYKVISTFQNKRRYKSIYKYYYKFFTFHQFYKLNNVDLASLILQCFNEKDDEKLKELEINIVNLQTYFSFEQCQLRNDELQTLMEEATNIE